MKSRCTISGAARFFVPILGEGQLAACFQAGARLFLRQDFYRLKKGDLGALRSFAGAGYRRTAVLVRY